MSTSVQQLVPTISSQFAYPELSTRIIQAVFPANIYVNTLTYYSLAGTKVPAVTFVLQNIPTTQPTIQPIGESEDIPVDMTPYSNGTVVPNFWGDSIRIPRTVTEDLQIPVMEDYLQRITYKTSFTRDKHVEQTLNTGLSSTAHANGTNNFIGFTGVGFDLQGVLSQLDIRTMKVNVEKDTNNYLITDPHDIARTVQEAFLIASTGRPGAVVIDLPSDVQRAQKCFERVMAFAPDNPYVRDDFERTAKATAPEQAEPACYVLFETGLAPSRDAVRIDIPIIVYRVSYVGISFPRLKMHDAYVKSLTVEADGGHWQTQKVASMDAVVAQDFKNELPSIIAHATASAVTKAVAAYALNTAAKKSGGGEGAQLLAQLATAGYQLVMNVADTRTWNTLPKEFQICKLPIPAGRRIALTAPEYGWRQELTLNEGRVVVIWVKAVEQPGQMTVTQFTLQ